MTTRILDLPLVEATILTGTNEDWLDAIAFLDAATAPISLAGISFSSVLRTDLRSAAAYVVTSTGSSFDGVPASGTFTVGGTDNNVLAWNVPDTVMARLSPATYQMDVVAIADGVQRRVVTGTVQVVQGVTR